MSRKKVTPDISHHSQSMNDAFFFLINNLAGKNAIFDSIGIFFATPAIFLLPGLFFFRFQWIHIAQGAAAAGVAYLINTVIGFLFFVPRPFVSTSVVQLIEKSPFSKSFPSDHTTLAFALATVLFFHNRPLGIVAFVFAFCIGLGRIFVGVHYPLDVAAGIGVGVLAGIFATILLKGKREKNTYA